MTTKSMHQAHQSSPSSFSGTIHVLEAIAINISRAWSYAARSKGRSLPVSFLLVFSELMVLPSMVLFDIWGWFFNRRGHAIIRDDFIPMSRIRASESRPTRAGIAAEIAMAEYREELINYRHRARAAIRCYALDEVAALTHHMLGRTIQFEEHHDATMIMHRHILESIGLSAMNHRPQDQESRGAIRVLSKSFILYQLQGLSFCGLLDGLAQASHATGVGIVENDVPYIPFHEKYVESLVA